MTVRIAAAAERDRKRAVNGYQAQARRQQRMALAQKSRDDKTTEKLAKAEYLAGQQEKVDDLNAAMQDRLANLQGILTHALVHGSYVDFDSLRTTDEFESFQPPAELSPGRNPSINVINAPNWFGKLLPGADKRYAAALKAAMLRLQNEVVEFDREEAEKRSIFANFQHE